jgi:flagellar hook-basal body complex protein FliE
MKRIQGLAAVLAVAALAGGGAVAAASSSGSAGTGTTTTGTGTTTTTTPAPPRPHPGPRLGGFGGLGFFDAATTTALKETFEAVQTAQKTAIDAGKAPDDVRDAAVAAAKARLDQAVSDGALTKAQGAAVLAALTKQLGARAAVLDAAAAALKLAPADLAKKLAAGDRLDEIAKAQGVDIKDVFDAIQKASQAQGGGGPGIFGPGSFRRGGFGFGFGGPGRGGPGMGGRFSHHWFGGKGPGHARDKGGNAPAPPTPTQPSTQSGSFPARPSATAHI